MEGEGDMSGETHEDNFEVVPGTEAKIGRASCRERV